MYIYTYISEGNDSATYVYIQVTEDILPVISQLAFIIVDTILFLSC